MEELQAWEYVPIGWASTAGVLAFILGALVGIIGTRACIGGYRQGGVPGTVSQAPEIIEEELP
jgi:hypothetical protein